MTEAYLPFDGETYEPEKDSARMGKQLKTVFLYASRNGWFTPDQVSRCTGYNWASISARLRDLRKPKFGGFEVERRRVDGGLWQYRLVKPC